MGIRNSGMGGQEQEGNLHQALKRECREEIGADIEIGELAFVREYIGANHEFSDVHSGFHQTEFIFQCYLKDENQIMRNGYSPDNGQVGIEWIKVEELLEQSLYPQELRKSIMDYHQGIKTPVYVGDIN